MDIRRRDPDATITQLMDRVLEQQAEIVKLRELAALQMVVYFEQDDDRISELISELGPWE
jgi:hypothetical protein